MIMNLNIKKKSLLTVAIALSLSLCACSETPEATSVKAFIGKSGISHVAESTYTNTEDNKENKYTKADYDLAISFRTKDYEDLSVEKFNRSVMDWDNEEAYHKTQESLERLFATLEDDDENRDFIFGPLLQTWRECEKKHYNACEKDSSPSYSGMANVASYGDVFGESLALTEAVADYSFRYHISDPAKTTVKERQEEFKKIEDGLKEFLKKQDRKHLEKQKTMEKVATIELERLLMELKGPVVWDNKAFLFYQWIRFP